MPSGPKLVLHFSFTFFVNRVLKTEVPSPRGGGRLKNSDVEFVSDI